MIEIEKFELFDFAEKIPYASITPNGIIFSKEVTVKLGYPKYVQLFINQNEKQLFLKPCEETEEKSTYYLNPQKKELYVRKAGRLLIKTISEMCKWDLQKETFRCDAEIINGGALFDLKNAEVIT